jgi:hypothetical protein
LRWGFLSSTLSFFFDIVRNQSKEAKPGTLGFWITVDQYTVHGPLFHVHYLRNSKRERESAFDQLEKSLEKSGRVKNIKGFFFFERPLLILEFFV